jgi:energy-coupling factor transporter ATP-binding protein EcfA2
MTKAWQLVVGVLVVLGVPTAVGTAWRHLIATHKVEALLLAIVWLLLCLIVFLAQKALAAPFNQRLAQAGNAADRAAGWWLSGYRRRYRLWVVDTRRYLDIKDLATSGDHTPELEDVYVDVALVKRAPQQVSGNPLSEIPEDEAGRHSLSEFIGRESRVVLAIVGPPGSGKSTLLAHAALQSASTRKSRLPVLLALREHGAAIAAEPSTRLPGLIRSAVQGVPGTEPDGWWDRQLEQGRCLVMLDGLDEVAKDEDRQTVATWVEKQIATYPSNHFVITSRPHGFPSLVIKQASVLAIRPFTSDQIARFLRRWYFAAERHATSATIPAQLRSARMLAEVGADKLITLLRAHPALRDLTVNPLLLTMIATVHRYRGALPGSRAELYGEICQVMLSRRIQVKNLPEILPWEAKRKILAALAYQMTKEHVNELPEAAVLKLIESLLARLPQPAPGPDFLIDISNNGLLVSSAANRYSFAHRTFQEYLTAQYMRDMPTAAKALVRSVEDLWWRETILLYAASSDANPIVSACLGSDSTTALSLAFECAEISHELSPVLRGRLNQVRAKAFEPECSPEHRRLIAGVLATQFTRETIITGSGARICIKPVPADLYWLFLQDTKTLPPDAPCAPTPDRPVLGMWATDAMAFMRWLNSVTVDTDHSSFRFPDEALLSLQTVTNALAGHLRGEITGVWSANSASGTSTPLIWIPPGHPHPCEVTSHQIQTAIAADVERTGILTPVRDARIINSAIKMLVALDPDMRMDGSDVRRIVLHNAQEVAHISTDAAIREMADEIASGLKRSLNHKFDLSGIAARFTPRVKQITRLAAAAIGLEPEHLAHVLNSQTLRRESYSHNDFDATYAEILHTLTDKYVTFNGISKIPLVWLIEGPLGRFLAYAFGYHTNPSESSADFAASLISGARLPPTQQCSSALDRAFITTLSRAADSTISRLDPSGHRRFFPLTTALPILWDAAVSSLDSTSSATTLTAATLRILALALANDSDPGRDEPIRESLHSLVAMISLLQLRAQGKAMVGECIVPALD